ncbi:MAG TPA: AMP-binding protein [Chloroflexota bacterium]|nr:AMP-binding protein [Chloroflexota bacterium]
MAYPSYFGPRAAASPYWNPYFETLPRAELDRLHLRRLQQLVRYAWTYSPFYRARLEAAGVGPDAIRSLDDYKQRMPIIDKTDFLVLQEERPPYGQTGAVPEEWIAHHCETSGTTGVPLRIPLTLYDTERYGEGWCYGWWAVGIRPGDSFYFAFNWGLFAGFWSAYWAVRRFGGKVVSGGGQTSEGHIRMIRRLRPTVLLATPTYVLYLAEVARGMGIDPASLGVRFIYTAGEPGPNAVPAMREQMERAWGARANELLGVAELHAYAPGCPTGEGVHVDESGTFAWVRDPATGREVAEGEVGETIVTSYTNLAQPLLNYRTHDLVRPYYACRCGRTGLFYQGVVLGRTDFMVCVRGTNVYQAAVENVLGRVAGLSSHYELVLTRERGLDQMTVRAEPQPEVPAAEYAALAARTARAIQEALKVRLAVTLVPPGTLPRYELKTRRIIDQRPKEVRYALERQ